MNYQKKASPDFGFRIDRNSPTPLNIQLRDGLRTYIRNHFFDPDPVLPSMLELASYFMVARNTVETALDMLEAEHLVYKKRHAGTFFGHAAAKCFRRKAAIGLLFPVPPIAIYEPLIAALQKRLGELGMEPRVYRWPSHQNSLRDLRMGQAREECDAIIFNALRKDEELLEKIRKDRFCTVLFDHHFSGFSAVLTDYYDAGARLTARLLAAGRTRIAPILPPDIGNLHFHHISEELLLSGYRKMLGIRQIDELPTFRLDIRDKDFTRPLLDFIVRHRVDGLLTGPIQGEITMTFFTSPVREHLLERGVLLAGVSESRIPAKYRPEPLLAAMAVQQLDAIADELIRRLETLLDNPLTTPCTTLVAAAMQPQTDEEKAQQSIFPEREQHPHIPIIK